MDTGIFGHYIEVRGKKWPLMKRQRLRMAKQASRRRDAKLVLPPTTLDVE